MHSIRDINRAAPRSARWGFGKFYREPAAPCDFKKF